MDKAARIRWAVLLSALCATVAAIFYPVATPVDKTSAVVRHRTPKLATAAPVPAPVTMRGLWDPLLADPFAPRKWDAPPPAPVPMPAAPAPAPAVAAVVVPPAGPPALPFQFVGQMTDSTQQVVYLSLGDQALLARVGEVLEGTYKVLAITPVQIEFEHIPTGQKQALVFPSRNN